MKRGFLKTEKAKVKLAAATDASEDDQSRHKDKGKAKAETPADSNKPKPPLFDLHSAPPSTRTMLDGKNRAVFRFWPRDPNGKIILPNDTHGKEAGNGLNLWGATLYDFFFVHRIPSNFHGVSISTGSRLIKIMEAFGELEHARDEIAWARREADPKEIPAWDPAQAIVAHERRVHAGLGVVHKTGKKSSTPEDVQMRDVSEPVSTQPTEPRKDTVEVISEENSANADAKMQQPPSDIPVTSPFHSSHYPPPWPLVPFEGPCSPFLLQQGIPIHLLPKKLHVHDPWKLVNINPTRSLEKESWTSKTDHVLTYTLSLPPETRKVVEAASKAAAAAQDDALLDTVFISPQGTQGPTEQPAVHAFLPKRPRRPTEVPEAHLYLSPKGRLGIGNHSIVYETELELPRDLFCESTYCKLCLAEQIKVEVDRLKDSGEWELLLEKAAEKYDGPGKRTAVSRSPSSSAVQIPPRYVGFVEVTLEHVPMETMDVVAATTFGETPPADAPVQMYARVSDAATKLNIDYKGLVVPVYPKIQWQNPSFPDTICEHQSRNMKPVPRTARFRVAAKMSFEGDPHLEREASNYLKFPAHFFQHWTGYNVIPPLHDPTPVGALVPQFFGYYTPDDTEGQNAYRSPILLIEHCGKPICVEKLSTDDRHECAALLFRFHHAGWLHESFAERNIVVQKQHPTCSPLEDKDQCEIPHKHRPHSFRLIDFGRSTEFQYASGGGHEENLGKKLFGIL